MTGQAVCGITMTHGKSTITGRCVLPADHQEADTDHQDEHGCTASHSSSSVIAHSGYGGTDMTLNFPGFPPIKAVGPVITAIETPPCPACGSPEPDCEPGCPAVPPRMPGTGPAAP